MADRYDVVIIGAGLIGSSIAWRLVSEGCTDVALLDVDLAGLFSASELCAGGVRAMWSSPVDVQLAQSSIEFYRTIREETGFKQRGWLWIHGDSTWEAVCQARALYDDQKLAVEFLTPEEIQKWLPEVDNWEGVKGATFSPKDGLLTSNQLKQYYRARAQAGGATLLDHHMVTGMEVISATEISLKVSTFDLDEDSEDELAQILTTHRPPQGCTERTIRCASLVNASGAWSGPVAALWGGQPPLQPVRRQITLVFSREIKYGHDGMIVFPEGLYCHPEAGHTLCGWRDPLEKPGYTFKYGSQNSFLQDILPRLTARVSGYERIRHMGGWAGLMAETPDGSGLLGQVSGHGNIYEAVGFNGKGVAQSYAVGVCMADLLLHGRYLVLDGSALHPRRFISGPLVEDPLIL